MNLSIKLLIRTLSSNTSKRVSMFTNSMQCLCTKEHREQGTIMLISVPLRMESGINLMIAQSHQQLRTQLRELSVSVTVRLQATSLSIEKSHSQLSLVSLASFLMSFMKTQRSKGLDSFKNRVNTMNRYCSCHLLYTLNHLIRQ